MKKCRLTKGIMGLLVVITGVSYAGSIEFFNITERGGTARDRSRKALTLSGFETGTPADVMAPKGGPYTYTRTLTVSDINLKTGKAGGRDSFTFDLTYSSAGSKIDFRNNTGILLGLTEPLTVTIDNIQVLSGAGTVSFEEFNGFLFRNHDESDEVIIAYEGTDEEGAELVEANGSPSAKHVTHSISTSKSSITIEYIGDTGYLNGVTFTLEFERPES